MNGMSRPALALLLCVTSATLSHAVQPYAAWTASEATLVRSGPADSYYGVQELPKGTQLEVYQELPGGWLAVRPPEGSFSLVSATAIETVDYRTGRITRDQAASRVGSLLTDERDAVHVRLNAGELVEVLDPNPVANNTWIRIAPPAGEFRWVRQADVSRSPVPAGAAVSVPSTPEAPEAAGTEQEAWREREQQPAIAVASEGDVVKIRYDEKTQAEAAPSDASAPASPGASNSAATGTTPPSSTAGAPPSAAAPSTPASGPQSPAPGSTPAPTQTAENGNATGGGSFAQQIDRLEIQLSRRMVGPPNLWVFDDLERQAAELLSRATTPQETATVRALAERMARFRATALRFQAMQPSGNQGASAVAARPAAPQGQFDAVGILRPVVSKVGNAPPYALVDERGEVITFVTPSPSLNMQQHLGKRVGVSGTRSYLPNYRRRNIQTARVVPTETPLVR